MRHLTSTNDNRHKMKHEEHIDSGQSSSPRDFESASCDKGSCSVRKGTGGMHGCPHPHIEHPAQDYTLLPHSLPACSRPLGSGMNKEPQPPASCKLPPSPALIQIPLVLSPALYALRSRYPAIALSKRYPAFHPKSCTSLFPPIAPLQWYTARPMQGLFGSTVARRKVRPRPPGTACK